ncbi:hypothetical protein D6821_02525, partial [Candidatus Parcubacteria bacterium]
VYRILKKFVQVGLILELPGEPKRFDGNTGYHEHFICLLCQKIYDTRLPLLPPPRRLRGIGKIKKINVLYQGICLSCEKQKNNDI